MFDKHSAAYFERNCQRAKFLVVYRKSRNCNYILFTKLPWPEDIKGTFWSSSQAATCLFSKEFYEVIVF